jgi:hypothetical protein
MHHHPLFFFVLKGSCNPRVIISQILVIHFSKVVRSLFGVDLFNLPGSGDCFLTFSIKWVFQAKDGL